MTDKFSDVMTIGEKYDQAMKITDQAEADAYFEKCVEHTLREHGGARDEVERIERANLGYYAGYCSQETRVRVEKLFRCERPVFGSIEKNGPPTTEEAFEAGLRKGEDMGGKLRKQSGNVFRETADQIEHLAEAVAVVGNLQDECVRYSETVHHVVADLVEAVVALKALANCWYAGNPPLKCGECPGCEAIRIVDKHQEHIDDS